MGHSIPFSNHLGSDGGDGGTLFTVCRAPQWAIRQLSCIHLGNGCFEYHGGVSILRLFFIDPALVNGDNTPVWFQEYYLHLIGPAIILIDALFISRAFDQMVRGAAGTIALCVAFVVWTEGFVGPFNDTPVGSVTSGLTYPFLNDMDMGGRMNFYATTIATALVFYLICWAVAWGMRKIRG